jgi:type II secretory pathway component PulL
MRIDINLASQPYEDARQFWMRWGTALAIATIVTLALVAMTISGWLAARHDHVRSRSATARASRLRIF